MINIQLMSTHHPTQHNPPPQTLYTQIHLQRQVQNKMSHRIMVTGYFNQQQTKRQNLNIEQYLRQSLTAFRQVRSYIYIKGVFYIQILESQHTTHINKYLSQFQEELDKTPTLMNINRIVHQSYQNTQPYFKGTDCDNNPQSGPILGQTEKTQQQIQDRSFEIYQLFMEGARMRTENPSHRIGNMIVLSNDDMSILICDRFMSLQEYLQLYTGEIYVQREVQSNYPLPPSFFDVMEFLQIEQYESYRAQDQ